MGLPIRMPTPTHDQYIPERVPITAGEGQKSGTKAPGKATSDPDIMPQKTAQTITPASDLTAIQQKRVMEPKTRVTEMVSVGPYFAAKPPATKRPTTDAPLRIERMSESRWGAIFGT